MRSKYLDVMKPFLGKGIIQILIGQRRVGKSVLLQQLIGYMKDDLGYSQGDILYINKELFERNKVKTADDVYDIAKPFKVVAIDEVQDINGREEAVRSWHTEGKEVLLSGSNSFLLSGELSTYLSGRYIVHHIYPFDFREYVDFYDAQATKEHFLNYMRYGGMPYLFQLSDERSKELYLTDLVDSIVYKDIVQRYQLRNMAMLKTLLQYVAYSIGGLSSANNIRNQLKGQAIQVSTQQILDYIQYMIGSCIVQQVLRKNIGGKKIFEFNNKYYFTDVGLRNALLGKRDLTDVAGLLENVVYMHLLSSGREVYVGELVSKKEVDFVATKNGKTIYIQVSYMIGNDQETIDRETSGLLSIQDARPKYLLTMDELLLNYKGINHMNIWNFLTNVG